MKTLPNFLSVKEYAKQCGVQNRAIHERIKYKTVASINVNGIDFIDSQQSPPTNMADYRNKSNLHSPILPDDMDVSNLFWVKHYAKREKISPSFLYEQLILGHYKGMIIGDKIFIDATSVMP